MTTKEKKGWEWKQAEGHEDQPRVEWWLEQACGIALVYIAKRARRRGDFQTFNRILSIAKAGAKAEKAGRVR